MTPFHRLLARSAFLFAIPAAAAAQTPFETLQPGASYGYRLVSGQVIEMRLETRDETGSAWAVTLGEGDAAQLVGRMRYDPQGRVTAFEAPDGAPIETYTPHNCERVEGFCDYVLKTGGEEWVEQRINGSETGAASGVWTFSVFREIDGALTLQKIGDVSYDADGVVVDENWIVVETGDARSVRRIR